MAIPCGGCRWGHPRAPSGSRADRQIRKPRCFRSSDGAPARRRARSDHRGRGVCTASAGLMARELVFAPLGGVGEIGMNLALYGIGEGASRKWIAVDLGVSFASEEQLPGIDLIMPDIG